LLAQNVLTQRFFLRQKDILRKEPTTLNQTVQNAASALAMRWQFCRHLVQWTVKRSMMGRDIAFPYLLTYLLTYGLSDKANGM